MKAFKKPIVLKPSSQCAVAAISGEGVQSSVVIQDEYGAQVVLTPRMARALSRELGEIADIAEGLREPGLNGVVFPTTVL